MSVRSRPQTWEVTQTIFDELSAKDPKIFREKVSQHYTYLFAKGGYEPVMQERRLDDAWGAFCHDKKHASDSLHSKSKNEADHFKLSGILAYWLRRCAPVYDLRVLHGGYKSDPFLEELLNRYPSEFPAFNLGLYICSSFQTEQIGNPSSDVPDIEENNFDYYKDICFLLKRKNLSPHSLGMIYRSLFVPLRAKKETESAEDFFSPKDQKPSNKK